MNDLIQLTGTVEITAASADGKRPGFVINAYTGNSVKLPGYPHPVVFDLASFTIASQTMPVLREHNQDQPIGHTNSITNNEKGLTATGVISSDGPHAAEIVGMSRRGYPWQSSIGAERSAVGKKELIPEGKSVVANGRTFKGPVFVERGLVLREISVVSLGADAGTSAIVAARRGTKMNEFDTWLAEQEFDVAKMTEAQKNLLRASWPGADGDGSDAALVELRRTSDIEAVYRKYRERNEGSSAELGRLDEARVKAQVEGWDKNRAELEMIRAERPQGVFHNSSRSSGNDGELLTASLCRTIGMGDADMKRVFPDTVIQAADSPQFRGATIHTVIRAVLARAGRPVPHKIGHDAIRTALVLDIKAGTTGPSTYSLSGILGAVANKSLLAAYQAQASTWRTFSRVGSVRDFKTSTQYRIGGDLALQKLAPGGEIKHGTLTEESLSNALDTWAKMLGLDRRAIINDDLSALQAIPAMMGRASARAVEKQVYIAFLNNSSFFTAGRLNVSTGAGSALSIAGLGAAIAKFRAIKDADGEYIGIEPAILLVPPTLEGTARQIVRDAALIGAPTTPVSGANPWAPLNLTVVTSPWMEDTTLTGNSTAAWYLLGPPGDSSVMNVNFLDGKDTPTIETSDSDFNQLGVAWRVFFDFAASQFDYRGGVRSAGS